MTHVERKLNSACMTNDKWMVLCQQCGRKVHFSNLDEGRCAVCRFPGGAAIVLDSVYTDGISKTELPRHSQPLLKDHEDRIAALEQKLGADVVVLPKEFGDGGYGNQKNLQPAEVPPLPDHPRFKDGLFLTHYGNWLPIGGGSADNIEECCCIARCWWMDESCKACIPEATNKIKIANDWRDYCAIRSKQ